MLTVYEKRAIATTGMETQLRLLPLPLGTTDSGESKAESNKPQTSSHNEQGVVFEKLRCFDAGYYNKSHQLENLVTAIIWITAGVSCVCCYIINKYKRTHSIATAKVTAWHHGVLETAILCPSEVEWVPCRAWHDLLKWFPVSPQQ